MDDDVKRYFLLRLLQTRTTIMQGVSQSSSAVREAYMTLEKAVISDDARKRATFHWTIADIKAESIKGDQLLETFRLADCIKEQCLLFKQQSLATLRKKYAKSWRQIVGQNAKADFEKSRDWDGFVNKSRSNPDYLKGVAYEENCQTCVVAHYMRRRGWDVVATGNTANSLNRKISRDTTLAWIDPRTGAKPAQITVLGTDEVSSYSHFVYSSKKPTVRTLVSNLHHVTAKPGCYNLEFGWKRERTGHIITFERFKDGTYRMYDPQRPVDEINTWTTDKELLSYFEKIQIYTRGYNTGIIITPLRGLVLNLDYMSILRPSSSVK